MILVVEAGTLLTAYAFWKLKILTTDQSQRMHVVTRNGRIRTNQVRRPAERGFSHRALGPTKIEAATHIAKVPVEDLNVSVNNLQHHQLVVALPNPAYEEEGRISPVYDFRICTGIPGGMSSLAYAPLHARRRDSEMTTHPCTRGSYTCASAARGRAG